MRIKSLSSQSGYLAMLAILLVLMIGFLASTGTYLFTDSMNANLNNYLAEKSYLIAEAGAEQATRYVLQKGVACASITGNADLTNTTFDNGQFTVLGTANNLSNNLSADITSTATSLTLTSTTGFATSGIIIIDSEIMSYAAISGNSLTGLSRGIFTSTAASHTTGASVTQNQCTLDSTGAVPTLASSITRSNVVKIIPLFTSITSGVSGWTMGDTLNGMYTAASFDGISWSPYSFPATGNSAGGYGLVSISIDDVWMVGDKGNFYHWNGSSWSFVNVVSSIPFFDVSCSNPNLCHAVGTRQNTHIPGLADWTRAGGWVRNQSPGGVVDGTNLKGFHCSADANCWAVGDNVDGSIFYQWNGSNWFGSNVSLSGFPFYSVYCNSVSDCWAVGTGSVFARYTGSVNGWTNYNTSLPNVTYRSINCTSSNNCWAVGDVSGGSDVIVRWDGNSWTRDSANPTPVANLKSIACINSSNCWAVGGSVVGNNAVFVRYNGATWSNVTVSGMISGVPLNAVTFGPGIRVSIPSNSSVIIPRLA